MISMKWTAVLFWACLSIFSFAQEQLTYEGAFTIGAYSGIVKYDYKLDNGDTIFDGSFEFGNALEKEKQFDKNPINVSGAFKNNLPNGEWNFQFGNISQSGDKKLVNYQYVVDINGIQKSINFNLDRGKPDGRWLIQIDSLKNSEVTKTLFKSDFNYQNGVPQKSFRIENDQNYMIGRLLRDAVAHDVWSIYTKDGIDETENWKFNQGQLEKIVLQIKGASRQLLIDYGNPRKKTTVNLDKHYLDIIELQVQQQDTSHVFDHGMSKLLKTDDENYGLVLDFFEGLGTPLIVEGFKVNVPVFPLTDRQEEQMTLIKAFYTQSDSIIKGILQDSQLSILKLNDAETSYLYNVAGTIQKDYLMPIGKLVTYQDEDVLRHITRKKVISGLWPNGFPEQIVKVQDSLKTERIYVLNSSFYDFSKNDLSGVLQLAEFSAEVSNKLQEVLQEKLSSNKREAAFLKEERQMLASANALKKQVDSLKKGLPKEIQNTLDHLKVFTDNKLSLYSKMEENLDKLKFSQQLTTCFENAKELAIAIHDIPAQQQEIKKAYQDQVWNPFTATIMDEDIKKRLTKAYTKQLMPYYLEQIENRASCNNIAGISKDLDQLHDRMLAMPNEDTKKLERKLKRTEDPLTILALFGLSNEKL